MIYDVLSMIIMIIPEDHGHDDHVY